MRQVISVTKYFHPPQKNLLLLNNSEDIKKNQPAHPVA